MDIKEVLEKIGCVNIKDLGTEYQMLPPYRPSDNNTALCVNKYSGEFYDFVTKQGGSLSKLIKLTLNLPTIEIAEKYLQENIPNLELKNKTVELKEPKKYDPTLLLKLIKDHSYWIKRGISEDVLNRFEGGITYSGRMANRYVFPVYNDKDELVGFAGRSLDNKTEMPWKLFGGKNNWLFPYKQAKDEIISKKSVVLCESIGDCLSLVENGINNVLVTFGLSISPEIIKTLLKLDVKKIFIAFNNDSANNFAGNKAAIEEAKKLTYYFDASQIKIAIPNNNGDFNEMSENQINEWRKENGI